MEERGTILAAPTEIAPIKPAPAKPGWRTSEAHFAAAGNIAGIIAGVTEILPPGLRWVGWAVMGAVNVAYIISRGIAKK